MSLTHRERVLKTLAHEETDRVPIDLGGGPATMIHPDAYDALLAHIGFEPEPLAEGRRGSFQAAAPSEAVLQHFDVDTRGIAPGAPEGRPDVVLNDLSYRDEWGAVWRKAGERAPYINVAGPLQPLVDPAASVLDTVEWPVINDPGRTRGLREQAERIRNETDYALVLNLGNTTFALAQRVRGFAELLEDLLINEAFADGLMERITDVVCGVAEATLREVGDLVDCVSTADDMGIQHQAFMSADLYRAKVKPHHARLADTIHRLTDARFILHSDGAVYTLLPDIIDAGIQILNPVQTNATGMDPARLKREFGNDLSFWGGIDTQEVLPHGSPEDVAAEVRNRTNDLGRGGGWVLASVHNIQAEVPPQNIVAMYETALAGRAAAAV